MLIDLLRQYIVRIETLNYCDIPVLAEQIRQNQPHFEQNAAHCATILLTFIKVMPDTILRIIKRIEDKKVEPVARIGLVSALVYLVQPWDAIRDDAPGGYGLLDDCIVLRATHLDLLEQPAPPISSIKDEQLVLKTLASFAPPRLVPTLEALVGSIVSGLSLFKIFPKFMIEATISQMIRDPMGFSISSMRSTSSASYKQGRLSSPPSGAADMVRGMLASEGIDISRPNL